MDPPLGGIDGQFNNEIAKNLTEELANIKERIQALESLLYSYIDSKSKSKFGERVAPTSSKPTFAQLESNPNPFSSTTKQEPE